MKVKDIIKKVIKLNKDLEEFGFESKKVYITIDGLEYGITTNKGLKVMMKEYVKEFINALLDLDYDLTFNDEITGVFNFTTYEGKPYIWDSKYKLSVVVC